MFCYRRYGHNEADDPSYTQPLLYQKIRKHPSIRQIYADRLVREKSLSEQEVEQIRQNHVAKLEQAFEDLKKSVDVFVPEALSAVSQEELEASPSLTPTGVSKELLAQITMAMTTFSEDFHVHQKLKSFFERRREVVDKNGEVDWAFAESLAFGTLVVEGTPVRLSGQDSGRGTFSQRHCVLFDEIDGKEYLPLQHLTPGQAKFKVYDSLLSEAAVLGFEFGYSVADPLTLVLWEAQFGDFVNGAQVIIDQFIAGAEAKWQQPIGLALLLPHGYEGQGPEHSSARIEAFPPAGAENNMQVCNCTSAAQYFHLLRRQMRAWRKPLVVMTPKSFCCVTRVRLDDGRLARSLPRRDCPNRRADGASSSDARVILCSGKVYFDLRAVREQCAADGPPIIRSNSSIRCR